MHVSKLLLDRGDQVIGVDNLNDYYDTRIKLSRLEQLKISKNFKFFTVDIADHYSILSVFKSELPQRVINLAAQAGVRYSIQNPSAYIQSNLVGFANIIEACRQIKVEHLVYASSSSVYGANSNPPFSVEDNVDQPVSLYAATKKANELIAHSYSNLYNLPTTGLRYFTVYGPWGRPDMSPWLFTSAILERRAIDVFNFGEMERDFTYIDDVATRTVNVLDRIPSVKSKPRETKKLPYKIYNIGSEKPVKLIDFINTLEEKLGLAAQKRFLPIQLGDVIRTHADIKDFERDFGSVNSTSLDEGIGKWCKWYCAYTN